MGGRGKGGDADSGVLVLGAKDFGEQRVVC